jgi:hypothetical protein
MLVSLALPVVGQVTQASPDAPYLMLGWALDPTAVASLILEAGQDALPDAAQALGVRAAGPKLVDALARCWRCSSGRPVRRSCAPAAKGDPVAPVAQPAGRRPRTPDRTDGQPARGLNSPDQVSTGTSSNTLLTIIQCPPWRTRDR